jgi:hypothetical protein
VFVAPVLEPSFFALEGKPRFHPDGSYTRPNMEKAGATWTLEDYEALFAGVTTEKAIGEKSPAYLTNRTAPYQIKQLIPDVRLIAVLRNPIDRAFSHYLMNVRTGDETLSFADAVAAENNRQPMRPGVVRHYVRSGQYSAQIERYLTLFGPEQLRVYLYEDVSTDTGTILREIYEHIGVSPDFTPDLTVRYNARPVDVSNRRASFRPRSLARRMIKPQAAQSTSTVISASTRQELSAFFREDIVRLQALIGRDLSGWSADVPRVSPSPSFAGDGNKAGSGRR